jgi:hypothetical protein
VGVIVVVVLTASAGEAGVGGSLEGEESGKGSGRGNDDKSSELVEREGASERVRRRGIPRGVRDGEELGVRAKSSVARGVKLSETR